ASVSAFTDWVKENRHKRTFTLMVELRHKMRGYYNYYGVRGNVDSLVKFYELTRRILFKWLNRRSHRYSYTWEGYAELLRQFQIPTPHIVEGRQLQFRFS
ncbi:MAG: group II intron reverse transcriptase/maturase, partial [Proteobacteria bacterium]|nr:group II intron reverse transcriptase/maturase [Pseudomonadota bacterium]